MAGVDVKSLILEELQSVFAGWGERPYRVSQLLRWLYVQRVTDWEAMTNFPAALRQRLRGEFTLHSLEMVRRQGNAESTEKFLWRLSDRALIESVLIPANPALYGESSDRHTLCVSTQVGCAYGCKFCASGLLGFKRNLGPEEIVEQVLAVERYYAGRSTVLERSARQSHRAGIPRRIIDNLVIMGMGEPLANYANLLKGLKILNASWGGGIGARKITVSTSGLVPQIRQLADEPAQYRLAVSLHGASDEIRQQIMPVNRKYPLRQLIEACEYYRAKKGQMISLEYILIAGVNDAPTEADRLAVVARRLHAKVNLIPYNPVQGLPWKRPDELVQQAFLDRLLDKQVTATLRREKGTQIDAACGQLRLKAEQEFLQTPTP